MSEQTRSFGSIPSLVLWWSTGMRLALSLGARDLAGELAAQLLASPAAPAPAALTAAALKAESAGDLDRATSSYAAAAAEWHARSVPFEYAHALIGQGRCLVALRKDAAPILKQASAVFAHLGAQPSIEATYALLARSSPAVES